MASQDHTLCGTATSNFVDLCALSHSVVFFLSHFKSGGTEWFALRLARALAARGLRPSFLVVRAEGELRDEIEQAFPVFPLGGGEYTLGGLIRTIPPLVRFLRAERPQTVLSGLPLLNVALAIAVEIARVRPRLLMVEHMRLAEDKGAHSRLRTWLKRRLLRFAYDLADEVIAVSRCAADDLTRVLAFPADRVKVVYNPVIPEDFEKLRVALPPHPWLQDRTMPILVSVGRLLPVKDYPTLLRAFADLHKAKACRLLIFGEGEERAALEKLVQDLELTDCVALPGAILNVFAALSAADLFVLSSKSESFGNVIAEALACGVPVVSTDCGGPREILDEGRLGTLVPPGEANALAVAMSEALARTPDRAALAARGLSFSVDTSAARYIALFKNGDVSSATP